MQMEVLLMKKLVMVGALSILLAGCAEDEATKESEMPEDDPSTLEQSDVNTPPEDNEVAEDEASEDETDSDDSATGDDSDSTSTESDSDESNSEDSELAGYEEYATVVEVADVEGMKGIVETDNPGTRVILFEDENGKKTVKSVFVKNDNRLKIISLNDDGLLYNDILK